MRPAFCGFGTDDGASKSILLPAPEAEISTPSRLSRVSARLALTTQKIALFLDPVDPTNAESFIARHL